MQASSHKKTRPISHCESKKFVKTHLTRNICTKSSSSGSCNCTSCCSSDNCHAPCKPKYIRKVKMSGSGDVHLKEKENLDKRRASSDGSGVSGAKQIRTESRHYKPRLSVRHKVIQVETPRIIKNSHEKLPNNKQQNGKNGQNQVSAENTSIQVRIKEDGVDTVLPRIVHKSQETGKMHWESGKKKNKQKVESLINTPCSGAKETRNSYMLPKEKLTRSSGEHRSYRVTQSPVAKNVTVTQNTLSKRNNNDHKDKMTRKYVKTYQKFTNDQVQRKTESYWEKSEVMGQHLTMNDDKVMFTQGSQRDNSCPERINLLAMGTGDYTDRQQNINKSSQKQKDYIRNHINVRTTHRSLQGHPMNHPSSSSALPTSTFAAKHKVSVDISQIDTNFQHIPDKNGNMYGAYGGTDRNNGVLQEVPQNATRWDNQIRSQHEFAMQIEQQLAGILEEPCPVPCQQTPDRRKMSKQLMVTPEMKLDGVPPYKEVPHTRSTVSQKQFQPMLQTQDMNFQVKNPLLTSAKVSPQNCQLPQHSNGEAPFYMSSSKIGTDERFMNETKSFKQIHCQLKRKGPKVLPSPFVLIASSTRMAEAANSQINFKSSCSNFERVPNLNDPKFIKRAKNPIEQCREAKQFQLKRSMKPQYISSNGVQLSSYDTSTEKQGRVQYRRDSFDNQTSKVDDFYVTKDRQSITKLSDNYSNFVTGQSQNQNINIIQRVAQQCAFETPSRQRNNAEVKDNSKVYHTIDYNSPQNPKGKANEYFSENKTPTKERSPLKGYDDILNSTPSQRHRKGSTGYCDQQLSCSPKPVKPIRFTQDFLQATRSWSKDH